MMFITPNTDLDLGMMLVEKKVITLDQLRQAQDRVKLLGGYLSLHLVELGSLTDAALATFLTCQYGYSYLPVNAYTITDEALRMIPAQIALDLSVLPIEISDRLLSVAMADPLDKGVVAFLRQLSGCEIIIFVSSLHEIREGIQTHYRLSSVPSVLDKSARDMSLRDDLSVPYVSSGLYSGPNRRRYRRLSYPLDAELAVYPERNRVRIPNISMSGVLFGSQAPVSPGAHMGVTIRLDRVRSVRGILEVVRCEPHKASLAYEQGLAPQPNLLEVGARFTYLPAEDQDRLCAFLHEHLNR